MTRDLNRTFLDLIALLEEESGIYAEMSAQLEIERDALLHLDASALGEICSKKETLALRIKALDESRKVLGDRLGRRLGLPPQQLTVSTLLDYCPAEARARLDAVRRTLKDQALNCKRINDTNARAARRGVELITSAVEHLLADPDPAGKIYGGKGGKGGYGAAASRRSPAMVSRQV